LPVIDEQIRYNNELVEHAESEGDTEWKCSKCLDKNYDNMPNLKKICGPCTYVDCKLKPRKFINRLPDIDMWMICEDGKLIETSEELTKFLDGFGMTTSDINPIRTIRDVKEISDNIREGIMPKKFCR